MEALLCDISIIQLDWITEERDELKKDEEVWKLIQNLQQDPSPSDTFSWKNDPLWYKDHLYLCKNSQLKQNILLELHTSPSRIAHFSFIHSKSTLEGYLN